MKQFEYKTLAFEPSGNWLKIIRLDTSELEITLNEMGEDGWELTNTVDYASGGSTYKIILFFKREKRSS